MTLFSAALEVPWDRQLPAYAMDRAAPYQGAARMGGDVAVIAYGERVYVQQEGAPTGTYRSHSVPWLRGVRYTEEGPVFGPAAGFPIADSAHVVSGLRAGAEGEAWILTTVESSDNRLRIGRVTMDPVTLAVTVTWRADFIGTGVFLMDLWLAQRRMVLTVTGGSTSNGKNSKSIYLMDLDTGQLVAHAPLPLETSTRGITARAVSFHPDRQEVLIVGDRVTGGYSRPTFWTIPVTATTIGTAVRHVPPGLPTDYSGDVYSPAWSAQPLTGSRWMAVGIYSRDEEYYGGDGWGSRILHNYTFSGVSTIVEQPHVSEQAYGGDHYGAARSFSLALDGPTAVAGVFEVTDRTLTTPGTGVGGVRHVEMAEPGAILDSKILPSTSGVVGRELYRQQDGTVDVVALGGNRYLYLVGGSGLFDAAVTNQQQSFKFAAFAGGPVMRQPLVPGMKGTAPEENRRAFRRVN